MFCLVVLVVSIVHTSCNISRDCGCSTRELYVRENKGYHVDLQNKVSFWNAYKSCKQTGMQLLSFETKGELMYIEKLIRHIQSQYHKDDANVSFWTSGTFLMENGNSTIRPPWRWLSTGERLDLLRDKNELFSDEDNQGFNDKEYKNYACLKLDNYRLNREKCGQKFYFICETFIC